MARFYIEFNGLSQAVRTTCKQLINFLASIIFKPSKLPQSYFNLLTALLPGFRPASVD